MVFDWLNEHLPTGIEEMMISGGTADVLKDVLVSYFDEKLPPRPQLNGKAAIYYSNTGFNLPELDVPPGCQSRMADVYCLWQYLMSKPTPVKVSCCTGRASKGIKAEYNLTGCFTIS